MKKKKSRFSKVTVRSLTADNKSLQAINIDLGNRLQGQTENASKQYAKIQDLEKQIANIEKDKQWLKQLIQNYSDALHRRIGSH